MEIAFNLLYLTFIWILVGIMGKRLKSVENNTVLIAKRFVQGFFLLALGDTGHVGFRVIALLNGGLEANSLLVGIGALSTAITVTFLYMGLLDIWRIRFSKKIDITYIIFILAGIVRLLLFIPVENQWGNIVPPFDWSLYRNIPLMIQGFAVAYLYLKDGIKEKDPKFKTMAYCIIGSFAFYTPVILFVQQVPLIGMLMIPKTLMYMWLAVLAKNYYFPNK